MEFADVFEQNGGFDLVIGNPPWIKIEWNEQDMLSDFYPLFAIRDMNAAKVTNLRNTVFESVKDVRTAYLHEYSVMSGQQGFLSALTNYPSLVGVKNNLYKSFLPQAWMIGNSECVSAFLHPNSIFDDSNGGLFRSELYPHIRKQLF